MKALKLPLSLRLLRRLPFPRKLGILERLYGKCLAPYGTQWVNCSNNVIWKLDLDDACHRWIVYGDYEGGSGIALARKALESGGVYVDSGANIGQWLLYLGSDKNIQALAFEPVSSQHDWLADCLAQQDNWNVSLFKHGLGNQACSLQIQCHGARSTLHLDWFKDQNLPKELIQILPLDQVARSCGINTIQFWKLDVEGAELSALQGAGNLLKEQRIKTIYFECHQDSYRDVTKLLSQYDYEIFYLRKDKLFTLTDPSISSSRDLVARPKSLH